MKFTLTPDEVHAYCQELAQSNGEFKSHYPADSFERQPVHTVYGGANLFKSGFASKLGENAFKTLETYAPNFAVFARALGLPGASTLPANFAGTGQPDPCCAGSQCRQSAPVLTRRRGWRTRSITGCCTKLKTEPIEDNRIDFEDGYGNRPDSEEDGHAVPKPPMKLPRAWLRTPCHLSLVSGSRRFPMNARHARSAHWTSF
jgi:hypothetical protein